MADRRFGMACMRLRLSAWLREADDAEFAREAALPPPERRRAQAARAKEAEAEQPRERPAFPYATFLWLDAAVKEREIAATGRKLIGQMADGGCRCAAERRMDAECFRENCRTWKAEKTRAAERRAPEARMSSRRLPCSSAAGRPWSRGSRCG